MTGDVFGCWGPQPILSLLDLILATGGMESPAAWGTLVLCLSKTVTRSVLSAWTTTNAKLDSSVSPRSAGSSLNSACKTVSATMDSNASPTSASQSASARERERNDRQRPLVHLRRLLSARQRGDIVGTQPPAQAM